MEAKFSQVFTLQDIQDKANRIIQEREAEIEVLKAENDPSNGIHVSANSGEELRTGQEHSALGDQTSVCLISQSTIQKPDPRSPEKQGGSRGGEEVQMLMAADNVFQPTDETRSHDIPKNVQEEVHLFMVRYILAYDKGDIEGFIKLYSESAIENNKMDYEEIRRRYKKNFKKGRYKYGTE